MLMQIGIWIYFFEVYLLLLVNFEAYFSQQINIIIGLAVYQTKDVVYKCLLNGSHLGICEE